MKGSEELGLVEGAVLLPSGQKDSSVGRVRGREGQERGITPFSCYHNYA